MTNEKVTINILCEVLLDRGEEIVQFKDFSFRQPVMNAVRIALETILKEPEEQYQIGSKVALKAIDLEEPNDENACWSIKMLTKSRDQRAIEILVKYLHYDISGTDHINCCTIPIVREAKNSLDYLIGDDSKLKYKVAIEAMKSIWFQEHLKEWTINMLNGIDENATFYKPARELLNKLA
ncbi:MAG: hypothetical protein PVH88_00475 [Ignavibacteria bacterium]|jgi:hypothetical protein